MNEAIDRAMERLTAAMTEPGDIDWIQDLPEYVALPATSGDVVAVMVPTGALGLPPEEPTEQS